jgi:hypothetical protein
LKKNKASPAKVKLHEYLMRYRPELEYKFHPVRKWRFDYFFPDKKLAVEFEGGVFVGGGHTRGLIYGKNCEKYNEAAIMGIKVLRFTAPMVRSGQAFEVFERAFGW